MKGSSKVLLFNGRNKFQLHLATLSELEGSSSQMKAGVGKSIKQKCLKATQILVKDIN